MPTTLTFVKPKRGQKPRPVRGKRFILRRDEHNLLFFFHRLSAKNQEVLRRKLRERFDPCNPTIPIVTRPGPGGFVDRRPTLSLDQVRLLSLYRQLPEDERNNILRNLAQFFHMPWLAPGESR
jgi:hypothetical protein